MPLRLEVVQEVDVVQIVKFEPFRDGSDGTSTPLGQRGNDLLSQFRIEDFANANHAEW